MSRLIDADELLKFVEDRYDITWESDSYEGGIKDACSDIIEKIDNMPTIEPQRMRGKWETIDGWDGDEVYRCSECGEEFVLIDGTPKDNGYHFCPNCGADMRTNGDVD